MYTYVEAKIFGIIKRYLRKFLVSHAKEGFIYDNFARNIQRSIRLIVVIVQRPGLLREVF